MDGQIIIIIIIITSRKFRAPKNVQKHLNGGLFHFNILLVSSGKLNDKD